MLTIPFCTLIGHTLSPSLYSLYNSLHTQSPTPAVVIKPLPQWLFLLHQIVRKRPAIEKNTLTCFNSLWYNTSRQIKVNNLRACTFPVATHLSCGNTPFLWERAPFLWECAPFLFQHAPFLWQQTHVTILQSQNETTETFELNATCTFLDYCGLRRRKNTDEIWLINTLMSQTLKYFQYMKCQWFRMNSEGGQGSRRMR